MNQRFSSKTALVTGGGSGIGRSVCHRLAHEGALVMVLDIDVAAAGQVAAEIHETGGQAEMLVCDVSKTHDVRKVIGQALGRSHVDILVNSAGIAHVGNVEETTEADLDRLYNVNVKGVYNLLAVIVGPMKARRAGVIINLASIASSVAVSDRFAYSMTKGAVLAMTYSVAKDYIDFGVRCNCVSPARIHTPFVDAFLAESYPDRRDEMYRQLAKSQPIGRMGTPEEVAGLIAYLASDEASFITGSNFPIDGGFVTLNSAPAD